MEGTVKHFETRRPGKGYKGVGMEGLIAKWYANVTLKDIAEFKSLAGRLSQLAGSGVTGPRDRAGAGVSFRRACEG